MKLLKTKVVGFVKWLIGSIHHIVRKSSGFLVDGILYSTCCLEYPNPSVLWAMLMLTLGEYTSGWKKAWYLVEITFFGGVKLLV